MIDQRKAIRDALCRLWQLEADDYREPKLLLTKDEAKRCGYSLDRLPPHVVIVSNRIPRI